MELGSLPDPSRYDQPFVPSRRPPSHPSACWASAVLPTARRAIAATAVELLSSPVNAPRSVAGHGAPTGVRKAVNPPSGHCWAVSQATASGAGVPPDATRPSTASEWTNTASNSRNGRSGAPYMPTFAGSVVVAAAAAGAAIAKGAASRSAPMRAMARRCEDMTPFRCERSVGDPGGAPKRRTPAACPGARATGAGTGRLDPGSAPQTSAV